MNSSTNKHDKNHLVSTATIVPKVLCISEGCNNKAISHPEWDNEYCSVLCCYNHCKNTFNNWLANNKAAKMKTDTVTAGQEVDSSASSQTTDNNLVIS